MKTLFNLARNANRLEVRAEADAAEIILDGSVGKSWWDDSGITAKEFNEALDAIPKGRAITLRINSEGGSVKEGLGIYNAIKTRRDSITARVDGYALSIASVFPLAAHRVVSPASAIWMMHQAWSWASGNADDMRDQAKMLDEHDEMLAEIYAAETQRPVTEMRAAMKAETWVRGSQAVEFGLADETDEAPAQAAFRPVPQNYLDRCKNLSGVILNSLSAAVAPGTQTNQPIPGQPAHPPGSATAGISAPPQGAEPPQHQTNMNDKDTTALPKQEGEPSNHPAAKADAKPDNSVIVELATVKAQLATERKIRVTAEIDRLITETRLTNDERDDAITRAIADESYLAVLAKRPVHSTSAPVGTNGRPITATRKTLNELLAEKGDCRAQRDFLRAEWNHLINGGYPLFPQAANTDSAAGALTVAILSTSVITVLQNRLASLNAFARNLTQGRVGRNIIQVPKITAGGTAQSNPTSFEDATNFVSTVSNVAITPAHIVAGAHLTNAELQNGWQMSWFGEVKGAEFADKIQALVNAIITTGNFTATPVTSAAAAFGHSDLTTLWGTIKKSTIKNVILDGEYYAQFLPATMENWNPLNGNTYPGWDGFFLNTSWTGATANTVGFACNPQAIGVGAGLPLEAPQGFGAQSSLNETLITLPNNGMQVSNYMWFNPEGRVLWWTLEAMFGAALGDATAGVLVKSA